MILPLLLIHSWALAIDPLLALPIPQPMGGGRGAARRWAGGPSTERPGEPQRAQHMGRGMGPAHGRGIGNCE